MADLGANISEIKYGKSYKKLFVWQKADDLAHRVYKASAGFPQSEVFDLRSQLRRSSLSVALNLVEGSGRQNKKEVRSFANIALGSLAETEYLLEFCSRLGYLDEETYKNLEGLRQEVGNLLWRFYKSFN